MKTKTTTVTRFVSKYALTRGIRELKGKLVEYANACPSFWFEVDEFRPIICPGEFHRTYKEAAKAANKMRDNKIRSLERQIVKLKKLKF